MAASGITRNCLDDAMIGSDFETSSYVRMHDDSVFSSIINSHQINNCASESDCFQIESSEIAPEYAHCSSVLNDDRIGARNTNAALGMQTDLSIDCSSSQADMHTNNVNQEHIYAYLLNNTFAQLSPAGQEFSISSNSESTLCKIFDTGEQHRMQPEPTSSTNTVLDTSSVCSRSSNPVSDEVGVMKSPYRKVACISCFYAKALCSGGRPCKRCIRLDQSASCVDRPRKKQKTTRMKLHNEQPIAVRGNVIGGATCIDSNSRRSSTTSQGHLKENSALPHDSRDVLPECQNLSKSILNILLNQLEDVENAIKKRKFSPVAINIYLAHLSHNLQPQDYTTYLTAMLQRPLLKDVLLRLDTEHRRFVFHWRAITDVLPDNPVQANFATIVIRRSFFQTSGQRIVSESDTVRTLQQFYSRQDITPEVSDDLIATTESSAHFSNAVSTGNTHSRTAVHGVGITSSVDIMASEANAGNDSDTLPLNLRTEPADHVYLNLDCTVQCNMEFERLFGYSISELDMLWKTTGGAVLWRMFDPTSLEKVLHLHTNAIFSSESQFSTIARIVTKWKLRMDVLVAVRFVFSEHSSLVKSTTYTFVPLPR